MGLGLFVLRFLFGADSQGVMDGYSSQKRQGRALFTVQVSFLAMGDCVGRTSLESSLTSLPPPAHADLFYRGRNPVIYSQVPPVITLPVSNERKEVALRSGSG